MNYFYFFLSIIFCWWTCCFVEKTQYSPFLGNINLLLTLPTQLLLTISICLFRFICHTRFGTTKMFGKLLSHLLGNADEDFEEADNAFEELMEFEEGGWVIVNLPGEKYKPC